MSQGYAYNPNAFNFQPGGLFDYPDAMIRGNGHDGEPAYGHQEGAGHTPYRHRYGQDQDQPLMRPFDPSPLLQLQQRFDYHHKPQQQQHLEDHLLDSSDLHSNLAFAPPPHLAPQRFCPQDSFQSFTQENSLFLHSQHKPKRTSPPIFFSPPTPEDDMRASGNHFWGGKAPVETPYNQLLFDCLVTAPNFEMTLQDIYRWFVRTHPARFQLSEKGWQNSIRHNLSMNDAFVKAPRLEDDGGRSHFWQLTKHALDNGVEPTTRYRKDDRRSGKRRTTLLGTSPCGGERTRRRAKTAARRNAQLHALPNDRVLRSDTVSSGVSSRLLLEHPAAIQAYPSPQSTGDESLYNEAHNESSKANPYYVSSRDSTPASQQAFVDLDDGTLAQIFNGDMDHGLGYKSDGNDDSFNESSMAGWGNYDFTTGESSMTDYIAPHLLGAPAEYTVGNWVLPFDSMQDYNGMNFNGFNGMAYPHEYVAAEAGVGGSTSDFTGYHNDRGAMYTASALESLVPPALEEDADFYARIDPSLTDGFAMEMEFPEFFNLGVADEGFSGF